MLVQASTIQPNTSLLLRSRSEDSFAKKLASGLGKTLTQSMTAKTAQPIRHAATIRPWDWILFMACRLSLWAVLSIGTSQPKKS